MKIRFLLLAVLIYTYQSNVQNDNLGVVVEYSIPIDVDFGVYDPPLRINQVNDQNDIDYSNLQGLLQSFLSASNMEWALSDYLDENATTSRDEAHFEGVKNTDVEKNYIQLETAYQFGYENRKMAYIKYSFIMDKVPFPIIGMMSAEFSNNRWYINTLLNQEDVFTVLTNLESSVLKQLFIGESDDDNIENIITTTHRNGYFDMFVMGQIYSELNADTAIKEKIMDKRLLIEGYEYLNATTSSVAETSTHKILHPFVLDQAIFSEYSNKDKGVSNDENGQNAYENQPEAVLLTDTPIDLIHKLEFISGGTTYYIIKYLDQDTKAVLIDNDNGNFTINTSDKFKAWVNFLGKIKSDVFISLFNNEQQDATLQEIINSFGKEDGGINLDLVVDYFEQNSADLIRYFDN
ncbi:hypothetical protein KCTC52924_01607 [Arenibacter antarcticus]|uniref:Uncharacterized protein n=1 Tax=Arenibacter antarcticus TaxID=2040469 RepID=A0ABW5VGZ9_9FLAO|nr:hypothetical protein [Arenibacter sp. H213]MCM4166756.1 hypothetical protein [Arenibacter sp. H213]